MNKQTGNVAVVGVLLYFVIAIAVVYGWIANIMNIIAYETLEPSGLVIAQFIGIVIAPLGVILGWVV